MYTGYIISDAPMIVSTIGSRFNYDIRFRFIEYDILVINICCFNLKKEME